MKLDGRARMVNQYIVFILDGQRYALHLSAVDRVVRMVHITPLSSAPDVLLGVVNVEGRVMPVINVRHRFNLPKRKIHLSDLLIFARTERRSVVLVADAVTDVIECSERSLISAELILPGLEQIEGIIKFEDGLVVIQNLDKFLSLEEEKFLDLALATT
jgi:purine-binding chemotaxis protein CheW